jgi:hypothetical protein
MAGRLQLATSVHHSIMILLQGETRMKHSLQVPVAEATSALVRLGLPKDQVVQITVEDAGDQFEDLMDRCAAQAERHGMREEDLADILGLSDKEFENIFGHPPQT